MYTKLYSTILDSSIWAQPDDVRIVWITMLAMATKNGIVHASVDGLARRAQVPLERVREILKILGSEDPNDKSGVEGGRRIRPMQGSWELVNFAFYREAKSIDAVRKQQWRLRTLNVVQDIDPRSDQIRSDQIPLSPPSKRKRKTAEATALPSDWSPTEAHVAFAAKKGLDLELEVLGFKGWAEGRQALSWNGTFTTRLTNSVKFRAERGGKAQVAPSAPLKPRKVPFIP